MGGLSSSRTKRPSSRTTRSHATRIAEGVYKIQTRTEGTDIRVSFGDAGLAYERALIETELGRSGEPRDSTWTIRPSPAASRSTGAFAAADLGQERRGVRGTARTATQDLLAAQHGGGRHSGRQQLSPTPRRTCNATRARPSTTRTDRTRVRRSVRLQHGLGHFRPDPGHVLHGSRDTGTMDAPLDFCGTPRGQRGMACASGCGSAYVSAHYTDDPCNIHASIGR
jgi:hypothetical protein